MLKRGPSPHRDVSLIYISISDSKFSLTLTLKPWDGPGVLVPPVGHQVLPDVSMSVSSPVCPPGSCPDQ